MSDLSEKEAILCETVKTQFQNQGVFEDIKRHLQSCLVDMMSSGAAGSHSKTKIDEQDTRTHLVNQLIMEYFYWHQFNYSAEMFAMETGTAAVNPNRELLESALGEFQFKDIPILLEIVLGLLRKERGAGDE